MERRRATRQEAAGHYYKGAPRAFIELFAALQLELTTSQGGRCAFASKPSRK